jgi:hypothetical protein
MRSEKEIKEKIKAYVILGNQYDGNKCDGHLADKFYYAASVLEWALSEPEKEEEPLSAIELKELRGIMKAWKEEAELRGIGIKQGYSQAGQEYVQASGKPRAMSPSLGKYPFPRD